MESPTIIIGNTINFSICGLLVLSLVLVVLLPPVRRQFLRIWPMLALSFVLQVAALAVLNIVPHVTVDNESVLCLAEPVYDLGKDAPSIEMSTPLCRTLSMTHTIIGGVILVVALIVWALMVRRAYRITEPPQKM